MDSAFDEFEQTFQQFHYRLPTKFPADFDDDSLQIDYPIEDFLMDFDGFDSMESIASPSLSSSSSKQVISSDGSNGDHEQWSPLSSSSLKSGESSITGALIAPQSCNLNLPAADMEIDTQLSLQHLLKAYGEAMERGQAELMEEVSRCALEKANPLGGPRDRLVFNLFRHKERQQSQGDDYIGQECWRHREPAFQAFYQAFPFMRFLHFAANSAILESAPRGAGSAIRVVDFDLGEGVQWVPVIEAMAARGDRMALRLTSIRWVEDSEEPKPDDNHGGCPGNLGRKIRDVSRRLSGYAAEVGVELRVEEMNVDELLNEVNKRMALNGRREWIAFNCMLGLPGLGKKSRSRKQVREFLSIAQQIVAAGNSGIITFGEGDGFGTLKSCAEFEDFFDGCLGHYQTVLECMENEFPGELLEARLAIEALFISPLIDPISWSQVWEEARAFSELEEGIWARLGGRRVSRESLAEARELVGGKSWYGVGIGERENEMVLQWRGTPLVRFQAWGR